MTKFQCDKQHGHINSRQGKSISHWVLSGSRLTELLQAFQAKVRSTCGQVSSLISLKRAFSAEPMQQLASRPHAESTLSCTSAEGLSLEPPVYSSVLFEVVAAGSLCSQTFDWSIQCWSGRFRVEAKGRAFVRHRAPNYLALWLGFFFGKPVGFHMPGYEVITGLASSPSWLYDVRLTPPMMLL